MVTTPLQCFCRLCRNVPIQPFIGDCGHAFCRKCLKRGEQGDGWEEKEGNASERKTSCGFPCRSCGKVNKGGAECFLHCSERFGDLLKKYGGPSLANKAKRWMWVRKLGEDEFGLQPRLARQRASPKNKGQRWCERKGNGRVGVQSAGGKGKKADPTEKLRANAAKFPAGEWRRGFETDFSEQGR
ncbi:hypothetical protein VTI74DRAFT_8297 [Chaetomium olivicolor]